MQIWANVTEDGTAIAETALCTAHLDRGDLFYADDAVGERVDATGNEMLSCQWCGHVETVEVQ